MRWRPARSTTPPWSACSPTWRAALRQVRRRACGRHRGRPRALAHLRADGERRLGRADRGRDRAQERRGQDPSSRALRRADRPAEPHLLPRPDGMGARDDEARTCTAPCCSSISTSSSRSTTRWAIRPATRCFALSPSGCATSSAKPISSRASAATSSWCCRLRSASPDGAADRWRDASSRNLASTYDIDGHRVVIGASVGIAVAPRDGDQRRRAAEERRHGALSREVRRARVVALLRARDGREGAGAPQPGTRSAPGGRDRRVRGPLSAADQPEDRAHLDLRGAAALAASRARHDLAGRVHPDRRGNGPDRRDRQLGAAARVSRLRAVAGRRARRRQPFADPVPPRQCHARHHARRSRRLDLLPDRLEIEITESVLLQDTDATRAMLAADARVRRAHFARRFRHRLFEPELSAQLPAAQGEDRPLVPCRRSARTSARCRCCATSRA